LLWAALEQVYVAPTTAPKRPAVPGGVDAHSESAEYLAIKTGAALLHQPIDSVATRPGRRPLLSLMPPLGTIHLSVNVTGWRDE